MKNSFYITLTILFTCFCSLSAQEECNALCVTDLKQLTDQTFALTSREESSIRVYDRAFKTP
ncbi:MAG: hypothetical protein RSB62_00475, partial [Bacteroides sp.]